MLLAHFDDDVTLVAEPNLESSVYPTIYPELEREDMDSFHAFFGYYHKVKCKQSCPGFELALSVYFIWCYSTCDLMHK